GKRQYSHDLQHRETRETRRGVFADFHPKIPEAFRAARYVFLGNIDPELQLDVLDQVRAPKLVACDTMNYWIHSKRDVLLELLRHTDILMVNDSEARELSGDWNIYRAARWILGHGPRMTVLKQGAHGALLVSSDATFKVPAYPRRRARPRARLQGPGALRGGRGEGRVTARYGAAGVHLGVAAETKRRIAELVRGARTELALGPIGAFGGMVRVPDGYERPVLVLSTEGVGTKVLVAARAGVHDTVGEDLVKHCVKAVLLHSTVPLAFLH